MNIEETVLDNDQIAQRIAHLENLKEKGMDPYQAAFPDPETVEAVRAGFEQDQQTRPVKVAGRVMAIREHGKATFADLWGKTEKIQLYFKQDIVGEEGYQRMKTLDLGDIIGVEGEVFITHKGELSVKVDRFTVLSKSLFPMPEKWHGLKDPELRFRARYLDLIINPEVRKNFVLRSRIVSYIRNFLDNLGFLEVETPSMGPICGGATARPFLTHHNALDLDLKLRIATELHLKRLIVGGLERVYEIGRVFRNEGISIRHNPEFTMLELYQAYSDYQGMMDLAEKLISGLCKEVVGNYQLEFEGKALDLTPPYARLKFDDALQKYGGISLSDLRDPAKGEKIAEKLGIELQRDNLGYLIDKVFSVVVEPHLFEPTFIIDYPVEISPLAKKMPDNPLLTYRFEFFIRNFEIANAFSELNDPFDQEERFKAQLELSNKGDEEAHPYDEDFIQALKYGMAPTGGMGIGIDRLVMVLTGQTSIREVILFPLLRPEKSGQEEKASE